MRTGTAFLACLSVLVFATELRASHEVDGIMLTVNPGLNPGEVLLEWTGGQPFFEVFRSTDASVVIADANKLGETSVRFWVDTPPLATIHYYEITSQCGNGVAEGGEVCDGEDLRGENCIALGFLGGALACSPDCSQYDTSECVDCLSCLDCLNQACIDGECGSCLSDSDCCAPWRCFARTCFPPPQ